jgi:hypothetical protein
MQQTALPKPSVKQAIRSHVAESVAVAFAMSVLFGISGAAAQVQQPGIGAQNAPGQGTATPEDSKPGQSLSDKLSRSQGVVKPPSDIDPGIHAPAPEPDPQTTPVIPPPGTPGGGSDIQPK